MRVLVTGAAGFIGYHLAKKLLQAGHEVTGLDNLNNYYDLKLKQDRLANLQASPGAGNFRFVKIDLANNAELTRLFATESFSHVVNMAAQAGVRYSIKNPSAYIQANIVGFANLLENCARHNIEHLVFASSSSVYGLNASRPYSVHQNVDHPISVYAATKKSDELLAHSYSHLHGLSCTGLRFFTVYGPWGRPDMALYLFTNAIMHNRPIKLFNNGQLQRDFTYIDDITEGVTRVLATPATGNARFDAVTPDPATSTAPWRIYNIGNNHTIPLIEFVGSIEKALGKKAQIEYLPMQPGDVQSTWADMQDLERDFNFQPKTPLDQGMEQYVKWHRSYYGD